MLALPQAVVEDLVGLLGETEELQQAKGGNTAAAAAVARLELFVISLVLAELAQCALSIPGTQEHSHQRA
jgi:hypothetical protein